MYSNAFQERYLSLTLWKGVYLRNCYWIYYYSLELKCSKIPQLRGMTPWILADFRSPRRVLSDIQDGWNRKGLISETGDKKKAFFILQDYYKMKKAEYDKK